MAKKYNFVGPLATVLVVSGLLAGNASAQYPSVSQPTATITSTSVKPSIKGASASASAVKNGSIMILADVMLVKGTEESSPRCFWTRGGFKNSGTGAEGLNYFYDPVPGKLCPNRNSPTGWVKVAGGTSGREGYNPATGGV